MKLRVLCALLLAGVLLLSMPAQKIFGFTEKSGEDEREYLIDTPDTCSEEPLWNSFVPDRVQFKWATKLHPSGYGERLAGLEHKEGRFKTTFPSLHALFTAPASLFGACDWWPKGFSLPLTIENQVVMANTSGWNVDMSMVAWIPQFGYRLNIDPTLLGASSSSGMAVELQHTHVSGGSGDLVSDTTDQLLEYIQSNDIVVHLSLVNVVSINFMHKFKPTPYLTLEYNAGKNLWSVSFANFLTEFGGLTSKAEDRNRHGQYRFSGFFQSNAALHLTPIFDFSSEIKTEFSSEEFIYFADVAADMYFSSRRFYGLRVNHGLYGGMENNSINVTRWGIWTPAKENAMMLFVNLKF